jgi:branched-chain amino acid transport system ATP-binding protein
VIEVHDLSVHYGVVQALDRVTLRVAEGELVTLIGANGAGKSTLLKAIMALVPASAGDVVYAGRSIRGLPTTAVVRRGLGLVPEGRALFSGMSVEENLLMGGYQFLGWRAKLAGDQYDRVFRMFPVLRERRHQLAGTLSGGEQQMLALARALMARPRILLCDEPSTGLAPLLVRSILATLRRLCDDGTTVLLSEQDAVAALRVADRGYVLENGRVVLENDAAALLGDPAVISAYLGIAAEPGSRPGGESAGAL